MSFILLFLNPLYVGMSDKEIIIHQKHLENKKEKGKNNEDFFTKHEIFFLPLTSLLLVVSLPEHHNVAHLSQRILLSSIGSDHHVSRTE